MVENNKHININDKNDEILYENNKIINIKGIFPHFY